MYPYLWPILLLMTLAAYFLGRGKAIHIVRAAGTKRTLHSLPVHYGVFASLSCLLPGIVIFAVWHIFEDSLVTKLVTTTLPQTIKSLPSDQFALVVNEIKNIAFGGFADSGTMPGLQSAADLMVGYTQTSHTFLMIVAFGCAFACGGYSLFRINSELRARNIIEAVVRTFLICCSGLAIVTTIGIVLSVVVEALRFFHVIPFTDFLFGLEWSPQIAIREGQIGSSGSFGAMPIFLGTTLIAMIAMMVAIPIGLLSAIYLAEYASHRVRSWAKPTLEILAGIPTVVYGFFGALTVAPLIRHLGLILGLPVSSESGLAAGLVMGVMIIPYISSLSDDVIRAVPQSLRDGSLGLGATQFESIRHVVIPAALPGIFASILLAVSRAIGETMIVVMAAGLSANLTFNPLKSVTTVTVQIVTLLIGDQEFDSPKTLAAFALGLALFFFTLFLNFIALRVVRKYRERYE